LSSVASAQVFNTTVGASSTFTGNFSGSAPFAGTLIGNYNQVTNPGGTRTLPFNIFGTRAPAPANNSRTISGTGTTGGPVAGVPTGSYALNVNTSAGTVTLQGLSADLLGNSPVPSFEIDAQLTYQSFLTAAPNYSYPFLVAIPFAFGVAEIAEITTVQDTAATTTLTPNGPGLYTFSVGVPMTLNATVSFQGAPTTYSRELTVTTTGTINVNTGASTLNFAVNDTQNDTTPIPAGENVPFDLPPLSGTGAPASLLLTLTVNGVNSTLATNVNLAGTGVTPCPADWNSDGGVDGDDVIAFFGDWDSNQADFNNDGGTDGDDVIEFFGRWDTGC
jgi:hypothetical protein